MLGVALVAALTLCAGTAAAAPPCAGADMYIVAHQDDTLLFQSPDLCLMLLRVSYPRAGESQRGEVAAGGSQLVEQGLLLRAGATAQGGDGVGHRV